MDIEVAILLIGIMVLVGAIVGAGIIYSALDKLANAIKEQK